MFGLKIFVRIQTFRQRLFAPPPNFCHPDDEDDDGDCGDHDDLCDKRTLDLSEVSIQELVNHEDIVVEND